MTNTPHFFGSKCDIYLTNPHTSECAIINDAYRHISLAPPAQGNTLGNKDNIIDDAQTGQKLYRWEENAFAPSGAKSSHGIQYPCTKIVGPLSRFLKETGGVTMGVNHSSQRVIPNALATAFFMNALMVIPSFWAAIATPL